MQQIHKYPRTHHIQGSRLQPGDEDLNAVPFEELKGKHIVVEEKVDGANAAISFGPENDLRLQSRGHYLTGGPREKHFALFKSWAYTHSHALGSVLGQRYILYGEWLYAKHTVFYNHLPHYFMEFDVLDTYTGHFLSTYKRQKLLQPLTFLASVKVLHSGPIAAYQDLLDLLGPSFFIIDDHRAELRAKAESLQLRADQVLFETDPSHLMEGLYIKVESESTVLERYKYVRADFLTTVLNAQGHWLNRPIVPNGLSEEGKKAMGFC